MKAKILWVPFEKGGRVQPPIGPRYSTVARFDEDEADWQRNAWSVVATFSNEAHALEHFAEVEFLSTEAPLKRLMPGKSFELFEGSKRVAMVRILG